MKFLIILLLALSMTANAQTERTLKEVMSDLGESFKVITLGVKTGIITPKMIIESENIKKLIVESTAILPDTVLSLPTVDQPAAKEKYESEMKELEKPSDELTEALKSNNLERVKQLLIQLGNIKKQGHNDFKE